MADIAYARCVKCRHVAPLPADACPRCGKALEPTAPPAKPAAPSPAPAAPAALPPVSRPPGHPGATRATPGAARVSRRTLILAGVALAAVLALIVVASILSDRAEPTSAPGRVSDPGGRFYLSSWSIPETAKAGQSFRVTMQVAEDTARAALAQSLSVEAAGSEWGRQTLTPGEGSTREVVVFARIDTPGTYVVTVRIDGIAAGQRAIVVTR